MASTICDECRHRTVLTHWRTYPYCSAACTEDAERRRIRKLGGSAAASSSSDTPATPRRPGRCWSF